MKRLFAVLIALSMMLSLSVTAFAVESEDIYDDSMPGIVIAPLDATQEEIEDLIAKDFEEYLAKLEQDAVTSAKAGMPYPDGVNVWLCGNYMTFTDAAPVLKDGRTQVPFRAILEGLGATVTYDNGNIEAAFADGSVMKLAIGSKVMTYEYDEDKLTSVHMDVAPYIDNTTGRTYVPVRFIGETLGLKVTWVHELSTAYIVDWDAVAADIDSQFTNINAMMKASIKASNAQLDAGKNFKSDDKITLGLTIDGYSRNPMELTLDGTSITDGTNVSGTYEMDIDLGGYEKTLIEEGGEEVVKAIESFNGTEFDMIVSTEKGFYLRSPLLALATSGIIPENGWLGVPVPEVQGAPDMNEQIMALARSEDFTIGKLIRLMCEDGQMGAEMGYQPPEYAAYYLATIFSGVMGDELFTVKTRGSTTTYTLECDIYDLLGTMMPVEEIAIYAEEDIDFSFNMKATVKNDMIDYTEADMYLYLLDVMEMSMKVEGDMEESIVDVDIEIPFTAKVMIDAESQISETTQSPLTGPAEGELTVTIEELVNMLLSQMIPGSN